MSRGLGDVYKRQGYYNQDREFCCVVSLIDIRHPATALDVNMIEFLIAAELPFMIVCTKADKLSKNKCAQSIAALRRQLGFSRDEVEIIPISSANGSGIDDLKAALERRIKAYNNDESSEE